MKSRFTKGFTLIELLVVVAIIGILSSIVLVSLNSARAKARDASAKGSMSSIRAAAEIYYDTNGGSYGTNSDGVCQDGAIDSLEAAAVSEVDASNTNCTVSASGLDYAASIELNNGNTFCVDSTGFAGDFFPNGNPVADGTASTSNGVCNPSS